MRIRAKPTLLWIATGGIALAILTFFLSRAPVRRRHTGEHRIAMFDHGGGLRAKEVIPSAVTNRNEVTLENVAARSVSEMVAMVRNMSNDQRLLLAKRLAETPGHALEIAAFFKAWSTVDAYAAFGAAREFRMTSQREEALRAVFEGADPANAAQLVDLLKNIDAGAIPSGVAQQLLNIGLSKWAQVDPARAADFLSGYDEKSLINRTTYKALAENWATKDPGAALAWKDQQQDPDLRQNIALGIFQSWASNRPDEALAYVRSHSADPDAGSNIATVANSLAAVNPAAAKALVESLPPGDGQATAAYNAAIRLAHDDPAGTAAWLASLPASVQSQAAGAVATQYASQDPQSAMDWINTLTGAARDNALTGYATNARDHGDGISAALQISDEQQRGALARSLAQVWMSTDPAAFHQWLTTSGLPQETQDALATRP